MSDYKLPKLPSDEELGITKEDRERYSDAGSEEGELSKAELLALLGEGSAGPRGGGRKKGNGDGRTKKLAPADDDRRPRRRGRGPLTAALMVILVALSNSHVGMPRPAPANAADTAFSSGRAMASLIEIARAPHPPGSPEHARVRAYLLDRLQSLGLEPEVQTATSIIQRGTAARAATVRNVLVRIPGTDPSGTVLITAHYDSRELSPGAGDDGTGVVAILEAVRALRAGAPVKNDVIVLFTDAEELGMLGAQAFVDEHPWLADVDVVLSFEMRGGGGPSFMFETNAENGWVVRALASFDSRPFANSLAFEVYERLPNDTDFTRFKEAGKQGLNFAAIGRPHVYHQATDTPERLSESTLQHHGLRALAALRWLGNADLRSVDAPDVVYFRLPFVGMVIYDPTWVWPLSAGVLAAFLLFVLLALRRGARPVGMVLGWGVGAVSGGVAYATGVALLRSTARFHPESGALDAALYHSEGWYMIALVAAVFAIVTASHALARRWLRAHELAAGVFVVPLGASIWLGSVAPLGAMDLQWPVAGGVLSCLLMLLLGSRASGVMGWLVSMLLVVPTAFLLAPVIELLWVTLGIGQAPLLAVLTAFALYLCVPALEFVRDPNGWWAPVTGVTVSAAALGLGLFAARPHENRPAPSTLIYAREAGESSGLWVTDATADPRLDSAAIFWASVPAGATFTASRDMRDFGLRAGEMKVAAAPAYVVTPPSVTVLRDTADLSARRLSLGVRSALGAELLRFQLPTTRGTQLLSVNGHALSEPEGLEWVEHWGEPDSLVVLDFLLPPESPLELYVVEHLLRPQEIVGEQVFQRPPELVPDVSKESDRVVLKYDVAELLRAESPPGVP